jgi:hypothetical protein
MKFASPLKIRLCLALPLWFAICAMCIGSAQAGTSSTSYEKYATTSTGVDLYWTAYVPSDGLRHPAVLVLHPGGFRTGSAGPQSVAEDFGNAGFLGLAVEYRLAPPGDAMRSPPHPAPAQDDVIPVDNGHYPEQTDDVKLAIQTARADPRCDGRVYCVGGSAGASHSVYAAGTGMPGVDRPDLVVALSGPYRLDDLNHLAWACVPDETCFVEAVLNYLPEPSEADIVNHNYGPYLAQLHTASPTTYVTADTPPIFVLVSSNDTGGVDLYDFDDLLAKMNSVGLTEDASSVPSFGHYRQVIVPVPPEPAPGTHAFAYWYFPMDGVTGHPTVAQTVIDWLGAGPPAPTQQPEHELLNVSTRTQVSVDDRVMIGGFIVDGNVAKTLVLRALGPSLAGDGLTGTLADPVLSLYDSKGTLIEQNDNWIAPLSDDVVDAGLTPKNATESLIYTTLSPGSYTAIVNGAARSIGIGLFELYDLDPSRSQIVNLSTRGDTLDRDQVLVGGFIIGGAAPEQVLVRALGPSLTDFGISEALPDPVLELHAGDGSLLAENDNWRSDQEQEIINTSLAPSNALESAILTTLPPGNYTAIVRGANASSGVALVEIYSLSTP